MVMELYWRGAVSRGRSAELLGMPLADFLDRAAALGIPYFDYTEEEWAEELRQVEQEVELHPSSPMRAR
jgi:predicted HTH domain antitoxin